MKTSKKGIEFIKSFESLHDGSKDAGLQPLMDPIGIWTEGYGRAMRDRKGNFIRGAANKNVALSYSTIHNECEAQAALVQDLYYWEILVIKKLNVTVNQNKFDALVSHAYNTGGSATLFDLINTKANKDKIYSWFTERYITGGGKKLAGLVRRRKAEAEMFFS